MSVSIIQFPSGRYGFVGRIPRSLGTETPATKSDIAGGRSYRGNDGAQYVTKLPTFTTHEAAVAYINEAAI